MAKNLVIVESPAKTKTLAKFLGKDFEVTSSMGHIADLPKSRMGLDIENNFKPKYIVISTRKKLVSELKKRAKGKEKVFLAPDPDREGEAIAWHIKNVLGLEENAYRVSFDEITEKAVKEAFKHPRQIDMNLVNAQQARRILDRLVGYSISPLLWKKITRGLSAGRVQSVALRLIVDRERDIKNFIPKEYWEIESVLKKRVEGSLEFIARLDKINGEKFEITNKDNADRILDELSKENYIVKDIKESKKKRNPLPPFTTSKLQQDAFNKLGFPSYKTMKIAQELYEGVEMGDKGSIALITYMRTDSVKISNDAQDEAKTYVLEKFGKMYYPETPNVYKSKKNAQEAHEAIRPTLPLKSPGEVEEFLNPTQYKLYELIWNRFLASQMAPAVFQTQGVEIAAGKYLFKANGSKLIFDGFLRVYLEEDEAEEKNKVLPELNPNEILDLVKLLPYQKFTKPPARFNDASLVKALEEEGIGRPSTYASIIQTIILRNYVRREKGTFTPTELGILVLDLLIAHFPTILDLKFTAKMEDELDGIEEGEADWLIVLKSFYSPFMHNVEAAKLEMKDVKKEVIETDKVCEKCGKPMVVKWGKKGKFLSCSGFPECKNAKSITSGVKCPEPECGGELVQRRSKRGFFYGCSNYPKCTYITNTLPEDINNNKDTVNG